MSPAKGKDFPKNTKPEEPINDESWKSEIDNLPLNETGWKCVIAMIVETRLEHSRYLELFNEAADLQTRDSIFSLTYEKLIRGVKTLGKSEGRTSICNFAMKKIAEKGEEAIEPWLTCRLIKYFLIRAKTKNLEIIRSRLTIEKRISEEIAILGTNAAGKDQKSKKNSRAEKSSEKLNTRLRKRGEEWKDRVHVDDAPIDGPNLYVLISGFRDLTLAEELLNAGLPLTAIFKVVHPEKDPDLDHQFSTFWSSLEIVLKNPSTESKWSEVIFQTFCPPEINKSDLETSRMDIYKRISYMMYDLFDIKRQHGAYIKEMKLQGGLEEEKPEVQNFEIYETILRTFPEECISVAMILDALLYQIQGLTIREESFHKEIKPSDKSGEYFRSKIHQLNNKFDVYETSRSNSSPGNLDPRLILHGDDQGVKTHHLNESFGKIPADFGVRVLKEYGMLTIWKNVGELTREKGEMHKRHIRCVSECFDVKIDDLSTEHYLHLSLFDKLINGMSRASNFLQCDDLQRKISFPSIEELGLLKANVKRAKSQTIIEKDKSFAETLRTKFKSDSKIEYGKKISKTFECPDLFELIDTREMLRSDFIPAEELSPTIKTPPIFNLEEFDSVQFLTEKVFAQVLFDCFQKFAIFETRYFPPTDSMIVLFNNHQHGDKIFQQKYSASIRTPVGLKDFASFVIEEEKVWLEKEEENYKRKRQMEEAEILFSDELQKDDFSIASFYSDTDFLLPNSIKALKIRKEKSHQDLIETKKKEKAKTNPGKIEISKRTKSKMINPIQKLEENLEARTFSEEAKPHFLGYDVAKHRVQVSGSISEFRSKDGTTIRVNLEEWSYGKLGQQIRVKLLGNELMLHRIVGDKSATYRLTTSNGISMGFSSSFGRNKRDSGTGMNYQDRKVASESETLSGIWTPEMAVDPGFKASWPSGLVVETLPGDELLEPFYIRQFHLSKGPECNGIEGERVRVFLPGGMILVFLENEGLRVMRSNGTIVTCTFDVDDDEGKKERRDFIPGGLKINQNSKESVEVKTDKKSTSDFLLDKGNPQAPVIHSSVVLDPDGKLYEIYDGNRVRVIGEELVRTSSDYEVGEKFTRRNDGTNILMRNDGSIAVCFPDGTRITTGYAIEQDPVFCEWTEEELEAFTPGLESREETGFVSVILTTCMEHKNYATVSYNESKIYCSLSMPGNVGVQISSDTFFSVTINTQTSLEVKRSEILFTGRTGVSGKLSTSIFDLVGFSNPKGSFLRTTDSFGNVFSVDFNGETSYEKSGAKENEEELSPPDPKDYRLFAVKRDLSAYEYLHCSERWNQENDSTASIFFRQTLCTTLTTLNPTNASQAWLQSYKEETIRPTNEDRRDLLRSTYSVPWNCLVPYGKKGRGIWDRSWNLKLKSRGDFSCPEILLARTTQMIKKRDEKIVKRLQDALGCYWKKSIERFHQDEGLVSGISSSPEESETKDWLIDFGLGRKSTFDKTSYLEGLSILKRRGTTAISLGSQIRKKKTSGSGDEAERDEVEWYRSCLRDHIVPLYFDDLQGACFTWILESIDRAWAELGNNKN